MKRRQNDSVWKSDCVYINHLCPGRSAGVHSAVTGSKVVGLEFFFRKICEAELKWSTSVLKTTGCLSLKQEKVKKKKKGKHHGESWVPEERAGEEKEFCVMSVFPAWATLICNVMAHLLWGHSLAGGLQGVHWEHLNMTGNRAAVDAVEGYRWHFHNRMTRTIVSFVFAIKHLAGVHAASF